MLAFGNIEQNKKTLKHETVLEQNHYENDEESKSA